MLRKAWRAIKSVISAVVDVILYVTMVACLIVIVVIAPDAHHEYLRASVGSRTYLIQTSTGSGTGFAVKAPSGNTYIVTNGHVCDIAPEVWVTDENGIRTTNKVLKDAQNTDLCLIESTSGIEGLSIGSEPHMGQILRVYGHPSALPLSESKGELFQIKDEILGGDVIGDPNIRMPEGFPQVTTIEHCRRPINYTSPVDIQILLNKVKEHTTMPELIRLSKLTGTMPMCFSRISKAYFTTGVVSPGNSGSPVVDMWGRVVAVVVGYDMNQDDWTIMIPYNDLVNFLKDY